MWSNEGLGGFVFGIFGIEAVGHGVLDGCLDGVCACGVGSS